MERFEYPLLIEGEVWQPDRSGIDGATGEHYNTYMRREGIFHSKRIIRLGANDVIYDDDKRQQKLAHPHFNSS